ncbi:hypothetical protein A7D27_16415 [Pseudomonas sp. 1D4]|nr:hypothetical protein A7D27_16415 [Pseudomonas sp. 1D4]
MLYSTLYVRLVSLPLTSGDGTATGALIVPQTGSPETGLDRSMPSSGSSSAAVSVELEASGGLGIGFDIVLGLVVGVGR